MNSIWKRKRLAKYAKKVISRQEIKYNETGEGDGEEGGKKWKEKGAGEGGRRRGSERE